MEPQETARAWVEAVSEGAVEAHVPDLVFAEAANALTVYVRGRRLKYADCDEALGTMVSIPFEVVPARLLARPALALAIRRRISAYDACYLALAIGYDAVLVTADRRLAEAAEQAALLPWDHPPPLEPQHK